MCRLYRLHVPLSQAVSAVSTGCKCRFLVLEVPFPQQVDLGHQLWRPRSTTKVTRVTERGDQGHPPKTDALIFYNHSSVGLHLYLRRSFLVNFQCGELWLTLFVVAVVADGLTCQHR